MVLLASTYDQSRFLKAADLASEKRFKIRAVTEEAIGVGADKETKLATWFSNDKRGLVLNKTNIRTLAGAFGDDTAGWVGKIIIIFPTMAEFLGTMKPALRVRIPPPKEGGNGKTAKPATPPPDELEEMLDRDDELNDEINF